MGMEYPLAPGESIPAIEFRRKTQQGKVPDSNVLNEEPLLANTQESCDFRSPGFPQPDFFVPKSGFFVWEEAEDFFVPLELVFFGVAAFDGASAF